MKIKLAGFSVGVLFLFFAVAAISRVIAPTDANGRPTKSVAPGLITSSANALSNLFRNTIN